MRVILAPVIATAYALANGYLSIRAEFLQAGLDLGWTSNPSISGPAFPLM
jgi:hypothetical protein